MLNERFGTTATIQSVAAAAQAEAANMRRAVSDSDPDGKVHMSVAQFAMLARLIATMSDMLSNPAPGSFGDARYWVPLDQFARLRETTRSLDRQCCELRRELQERQIIS